MFYQYDGSESDFVDEVIKPRDPYDTTAYLMGYFKIPDVAIRDMLHFEQCEDWDKKIVKPNNDQLEYYKALFLKNYNVEIDDLVFVNYRFKWDINDSGSYLYNQVRLNVLAIKIKDKWYILYDSLFTEFVD